MTDPSTSPATGAAPPVTEAALVRDPASAPGSDAVWQAPWVASTDSPANSAQQTTPPQASTGHYGPGYADATRHYGDSLPSATPTEHAPPATTSSDASSSAATGPATGADRAHPGGAAAAEPSDDPRIASEANRKPDITSEEVGLRPPDRVPSESAPASENAALIFERS